MRVVCGLDVHKDSVFACILNDKGEKHEAKYGVLTPELEELHQLLLTQDVKEVAMIWRILDDIEGLKFPDAGTSCIPSVKSLSKSFCEIYPCQQTTYRTILMARK